MCVCARVGAERQRAKKRDHCRGPDPILPMLELQTTVPYLCCILARTSQCAPACWLLLLIAFSLCIDLFTYCTFTKHVRTHKMHEWMQTQVAIDIGRRSHRYMQTLVHAERKIDSLDGG